MHTQTHAYNTITRTHTHTHHTNTHIHTLILACTHTRIELYTRIFTCMLIFSFLKILKLTLVHINTHILLTYITHTTYTHKHTNTLPRTHAHTTHTFSSVNTHYTHTHKHTLTHTNTHTHFANTLSSV